MRGVSAGSLIDRAVPLVDLAPQTAAVRDEVAAGFARVLDRSSFIGGEVVADFEQAYAAYCGVRCCVGVGNGTDALTLVLRAVGLRPGAEVVLPANTFVATAEAVVQAGGRVRLVDCEPDRHLVDVEQVARAIGPATGAVVAVDLFGQLPDYELLEPMVRSAGIPLVVDGAQSHGAGRSHRRAGSFGVATATSFYPGKNLGAFGDGGAVLTDDVDLAARVRAMGNHGGVERYRHEVVGTNSRLDALQAVVLRAKLARLDGWNEERAAAAARYDELLADLPEVHRPGRDDRDGHRHAWHLYVVTVPERDRVLRALRQAGVEAGVHYPTPIHLLPAFSSLALGPGAFPVAESLAASMLSLPLFPGITDEQQARVVEVLRGAR